MQPLLSLSLSLSLTARDTFIILDTKFLAITALLINSLNSFFRLRLRKIDMHRSASWSRVSDESFKHGSSPSSKEHQSLHRQSHSLESNELPLYDPLAELAKKEKARAKFAENAVHLIPVVLLLCFAILWFFSSTAVDVGNKGDSVASRIEGLTLEGEFDRDSDSNQTGVLPMVYSGNIDLPKQIHDHKVPNKLAHGVN